MAPRLLQPLVTQQTAAPEPPVVLSELQQLQKDAKTRNTSLLGSKAHYRRTLYYDVMPSTDKASSADWEIRLRCKRCKDDWSACNPSRTGKHPCKPVEVRTSLSTQSVCPACCAACSLLVLLQAITGQKRPASEHAASGSALEGAGSSVAGWKPRTMNEFTVSKALIKALKDAFVHAIHCNPGSLPLCAGELFRGMWQVTHARAITVERFHTSNRVTAHACTGAWYGAAFAAVGGRQEAH